MKERNWLLGIAGRVKRRASPTLSTERRVLRASLIAFLSIFAFLLIRNVWSTWVFSRSVDYLQQKAYAETAAYMKNRIGGDPQERWWPLFWKIGNEDSDIHARAKATHISFLMLGNLRKHDQIIALARDLDPDLPVIDRLLPIIRQSYVSEDRFSEYVAFARRLEKATRHLNVRHAAKLDLARFYLQSGNYSEAKKELARYKPEPATPELNEISGGLIYELNSLRPGLPAPPFRVTDVFGDQITSDDLKGRDVAIVFWSSSCKPSSLLVDAFQEAPPPDLFIVMVALGDESSKLRNRFAPLKKGIAVIVERENEKGNNRYKGELARKFNVGATPTAYVLDHDGRIFGKSVGRLAITWMLHSFFEKRL